MVQKYVLAQKLLNIARIKYKINIHQFLNEYRYDIYNEVSKIFLFAVYKFGTYEYTCMNFISDWLKT